MIKLISLIIAAFVLAFICDMAHGFVSVVSGVLSAFAGIMALLFTIKLLFPGAFNNMPRY